MHTLLQLAIVMLCCLLGQGLSMLAPFPFPSSVAAMLLLLLLLQSKAVKTEQLLDAENLLLKNLPLFLLPAGVSILGNLEVVSAVLVPLLVICLASTVATFLATAFTAGLVIRLQQKFRERKNA